MREWSLHKFVLCESQHMLARAYVGVMCEEASRMGNAQLEGEIIIVKSQLCGP